MDLHIANPKVLMLVWLVPAIAVWWFRAASRRERALREFMSPDLQIKLRPPHSRRRFLCQWGLLTIAITLALIAAARPQWGEQEEVVFQKGRDLVVALDVSRSMLATDVHPNRLQRAKIDLVDLVAALEGDRAALLAFRNRATLLCPLTTDYAYFRQALEGAGVDSAPRGETDIGTAIRKAMESFDREGGAHKAIILITDGEDLVGSARKAAEEAAKSGIVIFTVGLGSREGAALPGTQPGEQQTMYRGSPVHSRLDNETLHEIATITHGAYIPVETASTAQTTLGTLYRDHLRNISAQDIEERLQRRYVERFQWFLLPSILFLFAAAALSSGRLAVRRRQSPTPPAPPAPSALPPPLKTLSPPPRTLKTLLLLVGLTCASAHAQSPSGTTNAPSAETEVATNALPKVDVPAGIAGARAAQAMYRAGDFTRAAAAYLSAAGEATEDARRDYRYNAAVSLYHAKRYSEAAKLLRELGEDAQTPTPQVDLGLGSALYQAAEALPAKDATNLQERATLTRQAADAFRRAARGKGDQEAALGNAALALQTLPEREEAAHIADLMTRYQSAAPGQVATEMLQAQRRINAGILEAATNASATRIHALEDLAKQQREAADLWVPLKGKLLESMTSTPSTNAISPAQMEQMIEATRDTMVATADALRDLDPDSSAPQRAHVSEAAIYQLWKASAPHADILREDLWRQTNAVTASSRPDAKGRRAEIEAEQKEARSLTELFKQRFEQTVQQRQSDALKQSMATPPASSPDGTGPSIPVTGTDTNDHSAEILDLTGQVLATQASALTFLGTDDVSGSLQQQQLGYKLLKAIEDLLPKSPNQQNQSQSQQNQQQSSQSQDNQKQSDNQKQESKDSQQQQQPQDQQQEESKQAEKSESKPDDKQQESPDVQRVLDRALQREREHESEKRRRDQQVPLAPFERDW